MASLTIWHGTTKPIKAIGKNQVKTLEFAEKYRGWHTFAKDRATQRAVKALAKKDYLEIKGDQFRFKYPSL